MSVENLLKTNGYWRIAASFLLCVFLLGSAAAVPLREYGDLFNGEFEPSPPIGQIRGEGTFLISKGFGILLRSTSVFVMKAFV
ncbi:hypothetical protein L596_014317 [Steinernema carpocapsae]|uniref:Uncharacterized protein n=1 Tax=Steinernema carpocapsae TaxID=34508 RepID=A0A4U5NBJ2_STECR|nr:hypothetical protein L596_014317 [Steinernema carpocapsae]